MNQNQFTFQSQNLVDYISFNIQVLIIENQQNIYLRSSILIYYERSK
jgi:hypothetical protein